MSATISKPVAAPVADAARTTPPPSPLLAEFSPCTHAEWRKMVETELKGAPFDKKMFTATSEGITLQPIYRPEDIANLAHVKSLPGFPPFVRGASAAGYSQHAWEVSQELGFGSPTEFNHAARNSIVRGLNAINMVLDRATRNGHDPDWALPDEVGLGGLSIATLGDLDRALDGIDLAEISLFVRSGASALPFAALLVALARKRKKAPAQLRGCIEMDPLGVLAHEGRLRQSLAGAYREMAALTGWCADFAPQLQTICVHSRAWHESGGNAVQELAFTLATGVEYLRRLDGLGVGVNVAAPRMRFAVTVGVNFFLEIAKLRALRMLWSRAVGVAGGNEAAQKLSLHVRTALWNKTVYDPYNNVLRATVEAFAGVLGGCQSLQVGAFDEVIRPPDDFSRRLARNTQLVLQKECALDHVIDPAGGSWCVETVTSELATRAWALFQEIEQQGGMEAAMRAGFPQRAVGATAGEKVKDVTRRRSSIIGINQYANPTETPLEPRTTRSAEFHKRRTQQIAAHRTSLGDAENLQVYDQLGRLLDLGGSAMFAACVEAAAAGATLGEITRTIRVNDPPCAPITPVCLTRAAAALEPLRAAIDRHTARTHSRPRVFLCNLGPLKEHKARADFARGFFSIGGYDVQSPAGFATPAEAVTAFLASGARIAVICNIDENYPKLVPEIAASIHAQKPDAIIVLAGYPQDQLEAHRQSGVSEFIHIRADALEVLHKIHARLGLLE